MSALLIYFWLGGITVQRREKGTGTIYQRENGTWIGRICIGRGRDGKIKHKCISGKTEAEVRRKIREYNRTECPLNPQQMLLKDYLMRWLTNIKKISLKPSSYDRLESTALKQVIPRIGTFKISEITRRTSEACSAKSRTRDCLTRQWKGVWLCERRAHLCL